MPGRSWGLRFLWLLLQLALVLVVMQRFGIQEAFGFLELLPLIFGGFALHALLPLRLRLPCFTLLSIASVFLVLSASQSLTLIGMALGLIGICHLPLGFGLRVVLLLLVGAFLAYVRAGLWSVDESRVLETRLLPLLGAMFMYRLAVYMYDLKNEKQPASIWERVSYFFMLPNVSFLLFPVVDYTTYRRSHYKGEDLDIYQRGVTWIYRGMTHLIAYRVIYQYWIPAPEEVSGLGGVVLHMLTTYLLYLRISGQFHIIVGLLCLFGFNLPGTHRLYYLATSFNDFWRRINIYWKDYMLKLFFYPTFMRLRDQSMTMRLVVSTLVVFLCTWLLHSYQWFWIRGSFPITAKDGIFWGILGVLVIFNSLHESKGTKKPFIGGGWNLREAYGVSAKTLGTFLFICGLWSLWSAHTIEEWWSMTSQAGASPLSSWLLLVLGLLGVLHLGVLLSNAYTAGTALNDLRTRLTPKDTSLPTLAGCGLLLLISLPPRLGGFEGQAGAVVTNLRADRLNESDAKREVRGYYEGLNDSGSFTSALSGRKQAPKGPEWVAIRDASVARMTDNFLEYELVPSFNGTWKDAPFVTNEWGMHDLPYAKAKPAKTLRIALVGASMEVAAGVQLHETYENLVERCLNEGYTKEGIERIELLNFAVGGYSMVQKALVMRDRVAAFEPDLVLLAVHATEERRLYNHLAKVIEQGHEPDDFLSAAIVRSGVQSDMTSDQIREQLLPVGGEIMAASMAQMAESCRAAGLPLLVLFLPLSEDSDLEHEYFKELDRMAAASEVEVMRVGGAFGSYEQNELLLAPDWDRLHLNVLGNQLLAESLCKRLATYLDLTAN